VKDKRKNHSSVGKPYEIDQSAIKFFLRCLPNDWLPRKQDPDFFVDYEVETVEQGEPTGLKFAAQVKGYEDVSGKRPLSYSFNTKHLLYYLERSKHPVFLFLINVTASEGYWLYAQKHLKEMASQKALANQSSLTLHFNGGDSLSNFTKFRCLLPEAEKFARDLHPGSIWAASQKRKAELESKDPRCSVSVSVKDGVEHITILPKESHSFEMRVSSKNIEGWQNFTERGTEVKVERGEVEIIGAPLLEQALEADAGGHSTIQFIAEQNVNIQIFCGGA
jgi:hypothetical protein